MYSILTMRKIRLERRGCWRSRGRNHPPKHPPNGTAPTPIPHAGGPLCAAMLLENRGGTAQRVGVKKSF